MNKLLIDRINDSSAYDVKYNDHGAIVFDSDYGVRYAVTFDEGENPFFTAYWFNLTNLNNKPSPGDSKIAQTVICIIEEFFRQNPDILLYMCDSADDQQAMRNRLFLRWFNGYEQQKQYVIRTAMIIDEGIETYVAIIIQSNNPQLQSILQQFEEQTALFRENKP